MWIRGETVAIGAVIDCGGLLAAASSLINCYVSLGVVEPVCKVC